MGTEDKNLLQKTIGWGAEKKLQFTADWAGKSGRLEMIKHGKE